MNSGVSSILLACAIVAPGMAQSCPGDLNSNGEVNGEDLGILLSAWGPCMAGTPRCPADISQDGAVDGVDLGRLLAAWGSCPVVTPVWATLIEARPDPAVVTDPVLRQRIIATGFAWRVKDTGTQIEMLLVPPGTFQMGCVEPVVQNQCAGYEQPAHEVTLTRPFYLGRFEVTQAQFHARMGFNPSQFQGLSDSPDCPVESLGFGHMRQFVEGAGMRFPSEAEWEYACRAGTSTPFHNGSADPATLSDIAWHVGNSGGRTHRFGQKLPNRFGFHDTLGNVAEWIEGCPRTYTSLPRVDPVDPPCPSESPWYFTSPRGGAWGVGWSQVTASTRVQVTCCWSTSGSSPMIGFRVARDP